MPILQLFQRLMCSCCGSEAISEIFYSSVESPPDQPDKKKRRRGNDGDFDSEARENSENGNGDEGNAPDGGRVEGNQTERTLLPEFQNEAMELNRLQILSEVFGSLRSADPVEFESFDPNFTGHMWVPSRNHSSENLSVLG